MATCDHVTDTKLRPVSIFSLPSTQAYTHDLNLQPLIQLTSLVVWELRLDLTCVSPIWGWQLKDHFSYFKDKVSLCSQQFNQSYILVKRVYFHDWPIIYLLLWFKVAKRQLWEKFACLREKNKYCHTIQEDYHNSA